MKMNGLLGALVLAAATCLPAAAQQPTEERTTASEPPVLDVAQLVLEYLTVPEGMDDTALNSVARLFKRQIYVRNSDASVRGPLVNMDSVGDGLFVYDTAAYVKGVKEALARAMAAVPHAQSADLRTETWAPRFVAADRLMGALEPLRRTVLAEAAPGMRRDGRDNVTLQKSPALLVLRDTPEHVQLMLDLLERIDQAPPQLLLTCWLVRGRSEEQGAGVPADLADNLRRLLPYRSYQLLTTAVIRTSVLAGEEPSLTGTWRVPLDDGSEDHGDFELKLRPGGLDAPGRRLSLERIEFASSDGPHFDTSAVIGFDEYTVLGAAGSEPLLVVLQVKPLAH
jgi:hypothetical protein